MNILQEIFSDHYEEMIHTLHPRDAVIENVEKMIHCGDPSYGGAMYGCPKCGKLKFVPFRCHSRFCPTCGNKYSMERTTNMSFKLINVTHRHCVFTIDENLRHFFLENRKLLNCLFHAVTSVVSRMFFDRYLSSEVNGRYVIEYYPRPGDALRFHEEMKLSHPLVMRDGRMVEGYLSLTPVFEDTAYQIYVVVETEKQ